MKRFMIMIILAAITAEGVFCQNGIIRELTGDVGLNRAGSSVFVAANVGDPVAPNTIVSTGFRSLAIIEVGSSTITVQPLTRLSLSEIQTMGNTETTGVNLQAGRVRVEVRPPAGARASFSVQSPASVASVRGTNFYMDAETLSVNGGRVIFSGRSGSAVIVTGGNASFIKTDGTAADPAEVAEESLAPVSPSGAPVRTARTIHEGIIVTAGYSNEN